jgi:nicotinate-nucleotide pyrophosphorylase (carboxylating)
MSAPDLPRDLDDVVARALDEDLGSAGDVTSAAVLGEHDRCRARIEARAEGVLAGLPAARRAFELVDPETDVAWSRVDGDRVGAGIVVGRITGRARSILTAERVALNFLTHLSGVATLTRRYVEACAGTEAAVLCTRKTLPGLRALERYAVECGGGMLHRAGLFDGVLIKDNHVALAGGVSGSR